MTKGRARIIHTSNNGYSEKLGLHNFTAELGQDLSLYYEASHLLDI